MNSIIENISAHSSKAISDAIRQNPNAIDLTVGVPNFGPPPKFLSEYQTILTQAAKGDLRSAKYAEASGDVNLRIELAKRYHYRYDIEIDPETEILITHGAAEALFLAILVATELGDEVIIPNPAYILYEPIVAMLGRVPIRAPASPDALATPDQFAQCTSTRTRLAIICSPDNPTGQVYSPTQMVELCQWSSSMGIKILHDEVFDDTEFADSHVPALMYLQKGEAIMVNSFSKRFGMTGWRVGWLAGSPALVQNAAKAHTYINLAETTATQLALATCVNSLEVTEWVNDKRKAIAQKAAQCQQAFSEVPGFAPQTRPIGGGFYCFPEISDFWRSIPSSYQRLGTPGECVSKYLLDVAEVGVVPGIAFGNAGANHVRISYAGDASELENGLDRISKVVR